MATDHSFGAKIKVLRSISQFTVNEASWSLIEDSVASNLSTVKRLELWISAAGCSCALAGCFGVLAGRFGVLAKRSGVLAGRSGVLENGRRSTRTGAPRGGGN